MKFRCSCKRIANITLTDLQSGRRCKKCGMEKISGKNHYRYNPNLTDEDREDRRLNPENIKWRKKVFKRDDFICYISGKRGGDLVAHHLESYDNNKELRLVVSNGICIGKGYHILFHKLYGYGNNTRAQFEEFLGKYQKTLIF